MQSWDGDALRCIWAQVWDELVLGLMELGGDASQHSGEKGGKPQSWGKQFFFFLHPSPFEPIFHLLLSQKHIGFFKASLFFRRKGQEGVFENTPWAYSESELAETSPIIQSIIYFGNTGRRGKSIQTLVKQEGTKSLKYRNSNGLNALEEEQLGKIMILLGLVPSSVCISSAVSARVPVWACINGKSGK